MSSGEIVARKPIQTRESAVATMRTTLADFRRSNSVWERDVESIFDDLETVTLQAVFDAASTSEHWHTQSAEQLGALATSQQALAEEQKSNSSELSNVKRLVEQQMEVMSAFSELSAQLSNRPAHENGSAPATEKLAALSVTQEALAEQHKASVSELTTVRQLVEQQMQLISSVSDSIDEMRTVSGDENLPAQSAAALDALAEKQQSLADQQQSSASELTNVRRLVEQQMQLMSSFSDSIGALPTVSGDENLPAQSTALLDALAEKQQNLAEQQQSSAAELAKVRQLVEQQMQLMTAISQQSAPVHSDSTAETWHAQSTEQLTFLAKQQQAIAEEWKTGAAELVNVRKLMEQQRELISGFSQVTDQIRKLSASENWQSQSAAQLDLIAQKQEMLATRQQSSASELADMRKLVEKQMALIPAAADISTQIQSFFGGEDWHERSDEQFEAIVAQQKSLAEEQKSSASALIGMRQLVEKQMELIAALSEASEQDVATAATENWQQLSKDQLNVLASQQKALVKQQQASASELTNVRQLVEKQIELMAEYSDVSQRLCALSMNESWQANSEEQLGALALRQDELAAQQKSSATEIVNVRRLLEQQSGVITALSDVSGKLSAVASTEDWSAKSAEQLGALAVRQEAFAGQQQTSASELTKIRRIVEQQMELMMAFFDVSARLQGAGVDSKPGVAVKRDPVVDAVKAQFEKLQSQL